MSSQTRLYITAAILLAGTVSFTFAMASRVRQEIERDAALNFNNASDQISTSIADHMETFGLVLRAGAGVFSASIDVNRQEWRTYVDQLQPQLTLPGVQGIGFSRLLQADEVDQHVASVRAEGFPDYTLTPAGQRELYTAIDYLEPFSGRNLRAFGFDMYSEPVRRAAMEQARDTGLPTLSGRVQLVQEDDSDVQAGTLMYFPVFNSSLPTTTPAERQAALLGWTYSPFRMGDLVNGILGDWQTQWNNLFNLYIYDGAAANGESLLYASNSGLGDPADLHGGLLHQHRMIGFGGRQWLLVFDGSHNASGISYRPAWMTLAGGLAISLLLFGLLLSVARTRSRAEAIAASLVAETRQHHAELESSEFRWRFAIEGAGDGLWDWDISSGTVLFSPRWKQMLGFSEQEVGNSLSEWETRIHPDDKSACLATVQAYLEGKTGEYLSEHRVRCKDGSYKWILDRGMVVNRSADGKPLRMIGTHRDINQQKLDELRLNESRAEMQRLHQAMDNMASYVYLKKSDFSYAYANKTSLALFGLTPETVVGVMDEAIFPPETVRQLREIDRRVLAGEQTREELVIGSGADQRVYLEIKTPIYSDADHKQLWGLCGISTDITERKRLEQALATKTAALQHAQRIGQMGSWTLDLKTNQVEWSAELFNMFGMPYSPPAPPFEEHHKLMTPDSFARLNAALAAAARDGIPYELELELIRLDGSHGWMLARGEPLRDASGAITHVYGIALDMSARIEAKLRIEHLGQMYATLSACNAQILHCHNEAELFAMICRVVVETGGMSLAWVGLTDEESGRINPLYWAGAGSGYLDGIEVSVRADDPHGRGPTGIATRENHPVWLEDFKVDPRTSPWHARAANYGWMASAALPICRRQKPIGALTFYSEKRGWYDADTKALLEQMAHDISFALDKLDAEVEAKHYQQTLQESEQRFRSLVEQSIVGAFIIQHDRFVYVNPRLESILGYPTGALAGSSPLDIVAAKDKIDVRKVLVSLMSGATNATEAFFTAQGKNGNLIDVGATVSLASYQQKTAIIGQLHDLANRRVAEEQIKRYARNLEKVFLQTVGMATNLVEMRDPYTAGHEKHVAELAMAIGREMQLPEDRIEGLRVGGYLHDVGKIMVPTEILAKPGRISEVEYALIKHHPAAGYEILKEVEFPWPVAQIALQHHERIDGSGYPKGLKGDEILLEARIIAVADVIESMASHRPYRPALGIDKALAEIENGKGTRYDPVVVDSCLRMFREKGYRLSL